VRTIRKITIKAISLILAAAAAFSVMGGSLTAASATRTETDAQHGGPFASMYDADEAVLERLGTLIMRAGRDPQYLSGAEGASPHGGGESATSARGTGATDALALQAEGVMALVREGRAGEIEAMLGLPERLAAEAAAIRDELYTERYIVKYASRGSRTLALSPHLRGSRAAPLPDGGQGLTELLILPEKANPKAVAEGLAGHAQDIIYIQPDIQLRMDSLGLGEEGGGDGDGGGASQPPTAPTVQPARVKVAVIDGSIDASHPALAGYMEEGWNAIDGGSAIYDPARPSEALHGTHVAGLIASAAASTGADVAIIPIKAFENGKAYTSWLLSAIARAESEGASIINASFGSPSANPALFDAIADSPCLVICSVGNARRDLSDYQIFPACYDLANVLGVASLNIDGVTFSYYSNYGAGACIAAQGRDAVSALPGGKYGPLSGTSQAAASVTGIAAAAASLAGVEGAAALREQLLRTADRLDCLENKVSGGRRASLANAVSGAAGAALSLDHKDDFDVHGYQPTQGELYELYALSGKAVKVAAGGDHTLVLKADGSVWAMGANYSGQCGTGWNPACETLTRAIGLDNIVDIAAAGAHSIALDGNGQVYTWGDNSYGQMGNWSHGYGEFFPLPIQLRHWGQPAYAVGAWGEKNYIYAQECVYAWGDAGFGQMWPIAPDGCLAYPECYPDPLYYDGIEGCTLTEAAGGAYHSLGLAGGRVLSWGANWHGQLGDGTTDGRDWAEKVQALPPAASIAGGAATASPSTRAAVSGHGERTPTGSSATGPTRTAPTRYRRAAAGRTPRRRRAPATR